MRPAVYHRPMTTGSTAAGVPRLTVAVTIDHDAISDSVRRSDPPVKFSHGEFGPRVGAPRILALLEKRSIASTWFVPGHTLETFPESTAAIAETDCPRSPSSDVTNTVSAMPRPRFRRRSACTTRE